MSAQVSLDPVRLSILSIPRDKVWIFSSSILQFLHEAAEKSSDNYKHQAGSEGSTSEYDEYDYFSDVESSEEESEHMGQSTFSTGSGSKRNLGSKFAATSKFDNSSKLNGLTSPLQATPDEPKDASEDQYTDIDVEDEYFFHVAYTPTECTVICAESESQRYFGKPLEVCKKLGYSDVIMLADAYLNLQISNEGEFDNSEKILELTRPLSAHKISLFFLSTHFADIVLIPYHLKEQVVRILTRKNFEFSDISKSYIINRTLSSESPSTPDSPSETISDLEFKTEKLFQHANITPHIDKDVRLLIIGARSGEIENSITKTARCIASGKVPGYFAITRTSVNEISLILPGSSRKRMAMGFDSRTITGSALDTVVPICIDLTKLPLDSTGIVAGLASRLHSSIKSVPEQMYSFEMSYLSMARSAILMIPYENLRIVSDMIKSFKVASLDEVNKQLSGFEL